MQSLQSHGKHGQSKRACGHTRDLQQVETGERGREYQATARPRTDAQTQRRKQLAGKLDEARGPVKVGISCQNMGLRM